MGIGAGKVEATWSGSVVVYAMKSVAMVSPARPCRRCVDKGALKDTHPAACSMAGIDAA